MLNELTAKDHGKHMACPTCSSPGRLDVLTPAGLEPEFEDSIWFNTKEQQWECRDCWLK